MLAKIKATRKADNKHLVGMFVQVLKYNKELDGWECLMPHNGVLPVVKSFHHNDLEFYVKADIGRPV